VTVYAFAIDNFKRPAEEVNKLMDFARDMFQKLLDERHKLMDTGKCVRVIGDLSLLAPDIQQLVAEIVLLTKDNRHKVLNICFPYASRHEMTEALQELQICVRNGLIRESDINESLISKFLYTSQSSDPDLLVRTSGETRLSDFLLWQTSFSVIAFADVLWPEFTIWDLFSAILYYQRNCGSVKNAKQLYESRLNDIEESADDTIDDRLDATRSTRSQRIADCLLYLEDKRLNQLKCMCNKGVKVDT
jgi:ditrans,polycis-polyprenyl diphosphate synthase